MSEPKIVEAVGKGRVNIAGLYPSPEHPAKSWGPAMGVGTHCKHGVPVGEGCRFCWEGGYSDPVAPDGPSRNSIQPSIAKVRVQKIRDGKVYEDVTLEMKPHGFHG